MLNIKTVIAAALLSGVAAVSFAQTPAAPKVEPSAATSATAKKAVVAPTKHVKKVHHVKAKKVVTVKPAA